MSDDQTTARYRKLYARLLRLYPRAYRERFAEGMEQTFNDLCRERMRAGKGLVAFAAWVFGETFIGIAREHIFFVSLAVMRNKNIFRIAIATALILLVPFVAMQFTDEVKWGAGDFVVAGALLFGAGLAFELVARKGGAAYRAAVGVAVAAALLLVWMNLAVGLIGSEDNPANLVYFGVIALGIVGLFVTRFQPRGMVRTLIAMAIAQALVPVMAMIIWRLPVDSAMMKSLVVNAVFVALWLVSAALFRKAAENQPTNAGGVPG